MKSTAILIPARYGSTRFPGKPLELLDGVPMIRRVADAARESGLPVYVLTDDQRVANCVNDAYTVLIDPVDYDNGTERCAAFPHLSNYDAIINVQGDMPDITVDIIKKIAYGLSVNDSPIATVYTKMNKDLQKDPNSVKLIHTHDSAHWFCRAGLEYGAHHLGVYGYTCKALATYPSLHQFEEERIEKLEQLRWLQNNYTMSVFETEFTGMEINTPEDLIEWHRLNSQ